MVGIVEYPDTNTSGIYPLITGGLGIDDAPAESMAKCSMTKVPNDFISQSLIPWTRCICVDDSGTIFLGNVSDYLINANLRILKRYSLWIRIALTHTLYFAMFNDSQSF